MTIKTTAQGDFSNDYVKYSSIAESDTKQTYVFSKTDGRLLSAEIEAKFLCFYRTIMKFNSIENNANLAEAFKTWNEPMLKVILNGYPLTYLKSNGYNGCGLTITGKTFKSGTYKGVFVPCEIKYSNGKKRKVNLTLSNDTQWGLWEVTVGI